MPLFDPTFYKHEQQDVKESEYNPTDPELMGAAVWIAIAVIVAALIVTTVVWSMR